MEKTFVVNTKLGAIDYALMVNDIASQYFYSDGEYAPQIGLLNAMRLFYNCCVKESKFDDVVSHTSDTLDDMEILATDDQFIEEFNKALVADKYCLDFANAFRDAMDIVNTKKTSFNHMAIMLKNAMESIVDRIAPALTQENIENIGTIARDISAGKVSAESIVEAYSKSERVQQLIETVKGHEDRPNVIKE